MADWIVWLILAGVLVGLEIFTGTFYLLMVGIGLAAGGTTAFLGAGRPLQFLCAAVVGVIATVLLRNRRDAAGGQDSASDPNVNLDIGQTIKVNKWHDLDSGKYTSRALYRGTMWDVDLMHGSTPHPGIFVIREVRGSRLLVSDNSADSSREEA
ncbi:NfeD family protein [Oxalobacteraceae bacterium R-40]|uniref:NfeD family protein n=1 Tax=Keguizhuia sedimenti TaxID=3064264 RepID=A0ABU1BR93_9BURK|nr:NfeD family protein [Oxalobacteraceae bacterium R-40]